MGQSRGWIAFLEPEGTLLLGHETLKVRWLPEGSVLDCIGVGLTLRDMRPRLSQEGM